MKGRKMISAVNSCNSVVQTKPIQFKGEQIQAESTKKEGMSTTTKTLLGLGALAAIAAGGLLIKKRVDTDAFEKTVNKMIDEIKTSEHFETVEYTNCLRWLKEQYKLGLVKPEDQFVILSRDAYIDVLRKMSPNLDVSKIPENFIHLCVTRGDNNTISCTSFTYNKFGETLKDIMPEDPKAAYAINLQYEFL